MSLDHSLPFEDFEPTDFRDLDMGPRVSCSHNAPQYHYGPVSIRNYLAGHAKMELRVTRRKDAPEWGDLFLKLPIEVKLLVLEQLHPIDLYHFSHSSKALRALIMAPNAAGVWKGAFDNHPDLPFPPRKVSYAKWAALIYGPGICGICGRLGGLTDFTFLRRFCEPCMRVHYAYVTNLRDCKDEPVDPDHPVCKLVPRTFRYHGLRYTTSYQSQLNAQYIRKDFNAMMRKYTLVQLVIATVDTPEVQVLKQEFEIYCFMLGCHVLQANACAAMANAWAMDVYRWCSSEYDAIAKENTRRCKERLYNLGHALVDLDTVHYSIMHTVRQHNVYRLTPRAFRKIRPILEVVVLNRKVERLKTERRDLIEEIYATYQKRMVSPPKWQFMPPACLAKEAEGFQDFLNAEFTERGELEEEYAMDVFPGFVEGWTRAQQELIVGLLPDRREDVEDDTDEDGDGDEGRDTKIDSGDAQDSTNGQHDVETNSDHKPTETPTAKLTPAVFAEKLQRLELAQTVIICSDCRYKSHHGRALVGWEAICRHMRMLAGGNMHPCAAYEMEEYATATAVALVTCVGLDPKTTTASEMTRRGDRFMCGNCISNTQRGVRGLKVYTWLECIVHIVEVNQQGLGLHESPAWHLLTPTATQFVKEHEYPYPRPVAEVWSCNLCDAHFSEQVNQPTVLAHVREMHQIDAPLMGIHYVADKRLQMPRRKPFRLGLDPGYEYRCLGCPKLPITQLWELQTLMKHIRYFHKQHDPVEDEDWKRVAIIERTVPSFSELEAAAVESSSS